MSEILQGESEILSIWNGSDAYEPIGCLTSNGLNETREVNESSTKCDPKQIKRTPSTYSYEVSFEGEFAETETGKQSWVELKEKVRSATSSSVTWRIVTTYADATTLTEYGTGVLTSLEKTAPNAENITFSGTISGSGLVTQTDPNA